MFLVYPEVVTPDFMCVTLCFPRKKALGNCIVDDLYVSIISALSVLYFRVGSLSLCYYRSILVSVA